MTMNMRIVDPDSTGPTNTVEVTVDDPQVTLTVTMPTELFDFRTTATLGECMAKLVRPAASDKPTKQCNGLHCRCTNLGGTCPNPHHGDHECPHEQP